MPKIQLTLATLMLYCSLVGAQIDLKIGQWKSYLPYPKGFSITQSPSQIYFASEFSILTIDKEEDAFDFMTKVEGLSDVGMSVIKYVPSEETLIATYTNSNIDLIKPNRIVNLPFIKEDTEIVGDRNIYNIHLSSDNLAYLACGFGVVELNVEREEFGFTTKTNLKVNEVSIFENAFYAATDEGVYRVPQTGLNLQDFGNWKRLGTDEGFPEDYTSDALVIYEDKLYIDVNDTLFRYSSAGLEKVHHEEGFTIIYMTAEGNHLLVGLYCGDGCTGKTLVFDETGSYTPNGSGCINRPYYAIEDEQNRIWYSDRWRGMRVSDPNTGDCKKVQEINAPYTHHAIDILVDGDDLWLSTERPPATSGNGFYGFQDGDWAYYNSNSKPSALAGLTACYATAVHPVNKKVYVASLSSGLWEMDGDNFKNYNETNSPLKTGDDSGSVRASGLIFDENNNLWLTNNTSENPLLVMKDDGTWVSNFPKITTRALRHLAIDDANNKWISIDGGSQGLLVLNEGDLSVTTDDEIRIISAASSELPSNRVNCITVDLDGDVWVGTQMGVVVFECGSNALDPNCVGNKPIVEVDSFSAYLLEMEDVRSIAVDGANRKWFGTTNGVFVQSPDGKEQIAFFDQNNSPLFASEVTDIGINNNTGEVFIGTVNGMVSLRAEATEGGTVNGDDIYAFPNPVKPEYEGPIAIKGLARDADIKITDVNGQLVYETRALGGQAIWDGKDYNGQRASSGVYLVFSTNTQNINNTDAIVTKILLLN